MARFQATANLLSIVQTCCRQGRSVIQFFEQSLQAIVHTSVPAPSLLPQL